MAHTKAGGSTRLGRDSAAQRLGVKIYGGQAIKAGQIIVRQRGTKFHVGKGVKKGKDDTIYAAISGFVKFTNKKLMKYTGKLKFAKVINVVKEK